MFDSGEPYGVLGTDSSLHFFTAPKPKFPIKTDKEAFYSVKYSPPKQKYQKLQFGAKWNEGVAKPLAKPVATFSMGYETSKDIPKPSRCTYFEPTGNDAGLN
jgi:hypothetical protein